MNLHGTGLSVTRAETGAAIGFRGLPMVLELGAVIRADHAWKSSFDGSLKLDSVNENQGRDSLGQYDCLALIYSDGAGPLISQSLRKYSAESAVLLETTALRDIHGARAEDSYFYTTFNSPVVRLAQGLRCLTYTWGLTGGEGTGIGGNFPDVALADSLAELPEQLRLADFSPNVDLHQTGDKPFAPFIAYDEEERTLVMAPLDHFLISPMRLIDTTYGLGVARGLHGAIGRIPAGTSTSTSLVFGMGVVDTVYKWGRLLSRIQSEGKPKTRTGPELNSLGFWNCYGGYYAQLFRPTTAGTLRELAQYFQEADIPVRYFGLDLWYPHNRVGFARSYSPDESKYPEGLDSVFRESGIPFLLHLSAFDKDNDYLATYNFQVEEGSCYPSDSQLYRDRAGDFREWGATGIWQDFLRTQLQNCHSLRADIGAADKNFDGMAGAMADQGLDVMMCMPTMGHYLASTAHANVVAVRTSTDYVNHRKQQVEMLAQVDEFRSVFSPQRNRRQNLFLSFLAGALGLAPSHDVFITNSQHPGGFADPNAPQEALSRALSAGVVGIGDQIGHVDRQIVDRLAFPDGRLAQPDYPPCPLVSTMHTSVPAFFTSTTVGGYRWTYVTLWNLTEEEQDYSVDLAPLLGGGDLIYDYESGDVLDRKAPDRITPDRIIPERIIIEGPALPGLARYLILVPQVGGLHVLGFPGKYVTLPSGQVKSVGEERGSVSVLLQLPEGREFTFAVLGEPRLQPTGAGLTISGLRQQGGLTNIDFRVESAACTLHLARTA